MRLKLLTVAACALAVSACASMDAGGGGAAPAFDAQRVSDDVKALSDDSFEGRGIATPAEDKVVDYLSRAFADAGFQPGGENGGWTQAVTLNRFTVSNARAQFEAGGEAIPVAQGEQIVISTRLPAARQNLADLPLVFVGYGTTAPERQWDDFKDVDVRGKVIVVLVNDADYEQPELNTFNGRAMTYYGRWTYKYDEAARRGAAGVLVVHETAPASYGWATVRNSWTTPQFDIVRQNAAAERVPLEGWIQRDVAVDLFRRAGLDFEAQKVAARSRDFRPVDLSGVTIDAAYDVSSTTVTTRNIIARLPGTTHPDETILYTGHWDHIGMGEPDAEGDRIFNGAVDNASGIAGLLELARVWGAGPRPERSIVMIAFTAEESGLLGSEFYAANPLYPLETTVAGFNLDAMNVYGRLSGLGVTGHGQSADMDGRLAAAAAAQGRVIVPDTNNAAGTYFRSDHFPLAKRGVPMAYPKGSGDFLDEPIADRVAARDEYGARRYHQAQDGWLPVMDFRGAVQDLEAVYAVGRDLAFSRDWPQWSPTSEFGPVRDRSAAARR
ncbi:MAG TPA: M28 family metallopeptidase [Brevundimonas sp.]|jgi:Zn-dependent M28 family amino/carboxypeptidase|uniref:M28 family metallopeptidase n=1 Tax=Brevundimonas sp. TaxID=1871086 RepID=UPI002DE78EEE|nr:M28 family metallopeptidase [Brevundimonas sp.]